MSRCDIKSERSDLPVEQCNGISTNFLLIVRQALPGENMARVGSGAPLMRSHMRNWASGILPINNSYSNIYGLLHR